MNCSVVIPTFRRPGLLRETLDVLNQQTDRDFEVIVACDGEDAETRSLASVYPASYALRWLFLERNRGQAAARNAGARAASRDILLFLDDDATAANDWVSQHAMHHRQPGNSRMIVYGRLVETYARPPHSRLEGFLRDCRDQALQDLETCYLSQNGELARWACFGVNSSIRRTLFLEFGGFDERLRNVDEDLELGTRLHRAGVRFLFNAAAIVRHRSTKDLLEYSRTVTFSIGGSHVYRLRDKGQANAQTLRLASIDSGPVMRRALHHLAWEHPEGMLQAAEFCQRAGELTGAGFFFRLWARLNSAHYWQGARAEGLDREWLRRRVGSPVPVLAFHSITVPPRKALNGYYLAPGRFRRFLHFLRTMRYRAVSPGQWSSAGAPPRPVMLTFDDAFDDFRREALPALAAMRMPATLFVVSGRIGKSNDWVLADHHPQRRLLSAAQIREVHRMGVAIGSHSMTHPFLTRLSDSELRCEVRNSKSILEDLLGAEVDCFAYPYGDVDERVRAAAAEAGYRFAMTMREGLNLWEDPLRLRRINVSGRDTLLDLIGKLTAGRDCRAPLGSVKRAILGQQ